MSLDNEYNPTKIRMSQLVEFMKNYGFEYEYNVDWTNVYFCKIIDGKGWMFSLTAPHGGNKNRWMLRAEKSCDFDRWSIAGFEKFYNTVEDFMARALIDLDDYVGVKV